MATQFDKLKDNLITTLAAAHLVGETFLKVAKVDGFVGNLPQTITLYLGLGGATSEQILGKFRVTSVDVGAKKLIIGPPLEGLTDRAMPTGTRVWARYSPSEHERITGAINDLQTGGNQGPQGPQGASGVGTQGGQGAAGSAGLQGSQGVAGIGTQGSAGPQGNQGFQGTQGNQGVTGVGTQGVAGGTGPQGNQGSAGGQGPQGNQGTTGSQGTQGVTGIGTQGANGTQGTQGNQGATGVGTQGNQGNQGFQGVAGSQGFQGVTGTGTQGNQGFQGVAGTQGTQGRQGFQGVAGTGTQGNQGATGTGTQGNQGYQGPQGNQGATGTGTQGAQGNQGSSASLAIGAPVGSGIASSVLYVDGSSNLGQDIGFKYNQTNKFISIQNNALAFPSQGLVFVNQDDGPSSTYLTNAFRISYKRGYSYSTPVDVAAIDLGTLNLNGKITFFAGGNIGGGAMKEAASIEPNGVLVVNYGLQYLASAPLSLGTNLGPAGTNARQEININNNNDGLLLRCYQYSGPETSVLKVLKMDGTLSGGIDNYQCWYIGSTASLGSILSVTSRLTTEPTAILRKIASQTEPVIRLQAQSSTTARNSAVIDTGFAVSADASRTGYVSLSAVDWAGTREGIKVVADGTQALIGFYGATPAAKSTGWTIPTYTPTKTITPGVSSLVDTQNFLLTLADTMKSLGVIG